MGVRQNVTIHCISPEGRSRSALHDTFNYYFKISLHYNFVYVLDGGLHKIFFRMVERQAVFPLHCNLAAASVVAR